MLENRHILGLAITFLYFCVNSACGGNVQTQNLQEALKNEKRSDTPRKSTENNGLLSENINKDIHNKLKSLESDIRRIEISTNLNEKSISNHISVFSWITGLVIGIAGLVLAIGTIIFIRGNKEIIDRSEKNLEESESLLAKLTEQYEKGMAEIKQSYDVNMQQLAYFLGLRFLLEQPSPNPEKVYSQLTPLIHNPRTEYASIFKKVIELDINSEITSKAREGLEKLGQRHKEL